MNIRRSKMDLLPWAVLWVMLGTGAPTYFFGCNRPQSSEPQAAGEMEEPQSQGVALKKLIVVNSDRRVGPVEALPCRYLTLDQVVADPPVFSRTKLHMHPTRAYTWWVLYLDTDDNPHTGFGTFVGGWDLVVMPAEPLAEYPSEWDVELPIGARTPWLLMLYNAAYFNGTYLVDINAGIAYGEPLNPGDVGAFTWCMNGPIIRCPNGCGVFDFDTNGVIDLGDFAFMQRCP